MALQRNQVQQMIEAVAGIFRLAPVWVPRSFMIPGRRLKLHPDDIYAYGAHRGGINERWFSSTTKASNGPDTTEFEGLSLIVTKGGEQVLLKDAIETAGDLMMGSEAWEREKGWNFFRKFFHNEDPFRTTCTRVTSLPRASASRASQRLITSRRSTTRPLTTFRSPSWVSNPAPRGSRSASAWSLS